MRYLLFLLFFTSCDFPRHLHQNDEGKEALILKAGELCEPHGGLVRIDFKVSGWGFDLVNEAFCKYGRVVFK